MCCLVRPVVSACMHACGVGEVMLGFEACACLRTAPFTSPCLTRPVPGYPAHTHCSPLRRKRKQQPQNQSRPRRLHMSLWARVQALGLVLALQQQQARCCEDGTWEGPTWALQEHERHVYLAQQACLWLRRST